MAWVGDFVGVTPVEEGGTGFGVDREIGSVEIERGWDGSDRVRGHRASPRWSGR